MTKTLMSVKEVAFYLGLSEPMIRKLVRAKGIPYLRIGSRLMFNQSSIDDWLKAKEKNEGFNLLYAIY